MKIEILGTGCKKCKKLEANVNEAVKDLGLEAEVVKVEDIEIIMDYGVMQTPALVVDGTVKIYGKVASVNDIKKVLEQ
ncbi:thioredoxin family protein [Bacillaceae bacterium IKA-2]|nr:thioredoxin family protein [Bacillaceae bacterium IKA-2]